MPKTKLRNKNIKHNDNSFNKVSLSTRLLWKEAESRGIKVEPLHKNNPLEFRYENHFEYLFHQTFSNCSSISILSSNDKDITKGLLARSGLSIARGQKFTRKALDEALNFAKKIGWPVVIKPINSTHGNSVFTNINDENDFKNAWISAGKSFKNLLVEKHFVGDEYRILATDEKVLAVTNRIPANVIGDGVKTIAELVEKKNSSPLRTEGEALKKIKLDEPAIEYLKKQNMTTRYIPKEEERVFLRNNSNISTGGDSIDFSDRIHPSVAKIAVEAIRAIPGLKYGGLDFLTQDVSIEQKPDSYIVIEINSSPMISMHHFPYQGKSRDVAKEIIDLVFPETKGL